MTITQKTTDVTAPRRSHWWWTVPGYLAMVLLNAAISYGIVRLNAPVTDRLTGVWSQRRNHTAVGQNH